MADRNFKVKNGLTIGENIAIDDDGTITGLDTDNLDEGSTNLYYTEARVDANFDTKTTDALAEGATNKYYSSTLFDADLATKDTDDLAEGSNLYFTDARAISAIEAATLTGITAGNISVGVATDNTIASTDTNGNITLDPNGTGVIIFDSIQRLRGESQATTNNSYTFPTSQLTSVSDNNGYSAVSSFGTTGNGYQANAQYIHYTADTFAGGNAVASLNFRQANGNSVAGQTIPWTGLTSVAPSASLSADVLGTANYNGYASTGFTNDIATQYQGGGIATSHIIQAQAYAAENIAEGTVTLTSANITAVASSFRSALGAPSVTGTKGQISFNATTPAVGQAIRVTGTLTGTATGIVSGQSYYIIATSSTTTATLSATPNGPPITTTAGTLTGLTLTRCGVTFTLSGQTAYPFGRNALVTVSNVTNVTDGTYPVAGGVTSLTSITLGIPHTVAPTLPGTQQFTCTSVTNGAGGFRIRAYPTATTLNPANRLVIFDTTAAATTFRSDTVTFNTGAYGGTGVGVTGNKLVYNRVYGQFAYSTTITPGAANTAAAFPLGTADVSNIATVGSTSRLIPGAAGLYNIQFSVQVDNADNGNDHIAYIWLRRNGTDVTNSMGQVTVIKGGATIASWNYLVSSSNTTDYWELMYAVSDTNITFPTYAATAFGPSTATLITTLTPVGA